MDINNCYCTVKFNVRSTGYGREMELRYAHGNVKKEHRIIGRVDQNGHVFNTNNERIGRIDADFDIWLSNLKPVFGASCVTHAGRAFLSTVEDAQHNEIAQFQGDRLGAAAATVCAMYYGFLGEKYEDFYKTR